MDIQKLLYELHTYHKEEKESNKVITPDFNAFNILSPKETQLSRFIGELLNTKGVHEQGSLFLNLFIEHFLNKKAFFRNAKSVDMVLEHTNPTLNGRIDIFLLFDNKFAVSIENKPFADDQEAQIMRYCDFMAKEYGEDNYLMIYLSADGSNPTEKSLSLDEREKLEEENKLLVISYAQIRDWLNDCIEVLKETQAERLTKLLAEFAEYINLEFRKQNELKNTPIRDILKNNILEAHQLVSLWNDSYKYFKELYAEKVNQLFNEELPKLVYEDLKSRNVIGDDWEYTKGSFDIKVKHIKGWLIKKKSWKGSGIGVYSDRTGYEKYNWNRDIANYFSRGFFPLILSTTPIKRPNYNEYYSALTGCKVGKSYTLSAPATQWWSNFPDFDYQSWNDECWSEIKPDGETVRYLSSFFEKLIKACETDIDNMEKDKENEYTESRFRDFVNRFSWIFAKTYANKAPHEYIVLNKVWEEHKEEFIKIAQFIRDKGFKAFYYTKEGYYYKLDENYYWTMDDPIEATDLINRAKNADYDLIDNTWKWKGEPAK